MVKAHLLKPLDGFPVGAERDFSQADFDRLEALNAVRGGEPEKKAAPPVKNKKAPSVGDKAEGRTPKNKSE